jgi:hypothetical protein
VGDGALQHDDGAPGGGGPTCGAERVGQHRRQVHAEQVGHLAGVRRDDRPPRQGPHAGGIGGEAAERGVEHERAGVQARHGRPHQRHGRGVVQHARPEEHRLDAGGALGDHGGRLGRDLALGRLGQREHTPLGDRQCQGERRRLAHRYSQLARARPQRRRGGQQHGARRLPRAADDEHAAARLLVGVRVGLGQRPASQQRRCHLDALAAPRHRSPP